MSCRMGRTTLGRNETQPVLPDTDPVQSAGQVHPGGQKAGTGRLRHDPVSEVGFTGRVHPGRVKFGTPR